MFWLHLSPVDQALLPARSGRLPRLLYGQFVRRTLRLFRPKISSVVAAPWSVANRLAFRFFGSSLSVAADELDRPALSLNKSKLTSLLELSLRTVRSQYAVLYGMLRAVRPRVAVVHAMVPDDPARALGACPALCRIDISLN